MVELVDVNTNDLDSIKYIIKILIVNTMVVTKEFPKSRNVSDIGSIRIYSEYYINESNNLTREQIENIIFPEVISPLQQEFKYWNEKLSHLHPKSIFRLAKLGILPSIFIELKYDLRLCASCMIVTASRMQWITKVNK